ncbi:LysR family transcriptional regulator [Planotetraspora silvatica]|uniref:LysR family transcriptional regulator n=1 Tax=Planotetraspora silvatica TaxID=234614 RepID=A0A8J3USD3_9ACTN|nr:LysR family transcriptional regulator [Planotetraspora silvatica]GII49870.1 LysR family transcriptional regulator [Planotetraspora silvatica]
MLDPKKLQILVDVAETGSIAGAADRAGVSASAASQQLAALERQIGAALLERSARSVRLTAAGQVLADRASRVLAELHEATRAVHAAAGLQGGTLRFAAFASSGPALTVPALAAFHRRHPEIIITFTEMEPEEAIPAVAEGTIDLAVTHRYRHVPRPDLRGLHQTLLYRDRLVLAVPAHARPAAQTAVSLADFADAAWVATKPVTGFQAVTEHACRRAGFIPYVAFRADDYDLLLSLVGADLGVALVPELLAGARPGIAYLQLADPLGLTRDVHITTRTADPSPAVTAMARCLNQQLTRRPWTRRPPVEHTAPPSSSPPPMPRSPAKPPT